MSTTPAVPRRHALGMPAGSVRALLALGVLGYLWLLITLMTNEKGDDPLNVRLRSEASLSFVYMHILMVLILAHFFSAHGHTIGGPSSVRSPLGLPKGLLRLLLLGGYLTLSVWAFQQRAAFKLPDNAPLIEMLSILVAAYAVGYVLTGGMRFLWRDVLPPWFLDVQAWFALLGLVLLGVVLMVRLVINTSVPLESQIGVEMIEAILTGIVGFYFGSRS
ncbi:MAG: hypothetical protein ACRC33_12145 [Gemmataceae bacterium]